ncbi:DUF4145 domain-containing protein [Vibrio breoganii]|uniref:DUF4145 domain-containing protein n=1 Tax=Vibrio breoganii TaxID=553239 RepID=UPI000C82D22D|nr:DUF4145 domain-containing protein [Vibrio breoganii]PMG07552.1 hypothetical protein BCV00_07510 [Vibrio breoganii]PMJ45332.1 hypothetical protein BCU21_13720 [Vibrio breoganii]PMK59446.1 hypothetical protein BCT97_06560 [Vibrio breoganii]PMO29245.1 hypothetical protein BCT14_06735 [Vibrio breoganii]PMO32919.1 hypothetical protein BCT13_08460 [Vibrio breoganii]
MNTQQLLKEISIKSSVLGKEIKDVKTYSLLDPDVAVVKARKALELIVNDIEQGSDNNLAQRISNLDSTLPDSVIAYMHFIRKLGNSAAHSGEVMTTQVAEDVQRVLLHLACWHLKIEPKQTSSIKARYFIAEGMYRTWPKIAVLTSDGALYSEYLTFMKPTTFRKTGFDFSSFQSKDFSFGEKEHGNAYQTMAEVSLEEALRYNLKSQKNWVRSYIKGIGIVVD